MATARFGIVPVIRGWLGRPIATSALGCSLREFIERSGLIYLKLGQYLAMRTDLVPPAVGRELDQLFEEVSPMPFAEVERVLQRELGKPWSECFATLDPIPVGSASVAQVHLATTTDGKRLAVKVQRTGIQKNFEAAARVFQGLAWIADALRLAGELSLYEFFAEFVEFTTRELDFELEGKTAERLGDGISEWGRVPVIEWSLTTKRLLSMEFIEGKTFLDLCRPDKPGNEDVEALLSEIDLLRVVQALAFECFHQLFETGFFHGDPHPGNVILTRDGKFVFLDFGIFGEMSIDLRRNVRLFVENLALGRFSESATHYTKLCRPTAATDMGAWTSDLSTALAAWHATLRDPHAPIDIRHLGHLQGEVTKAMRRHRVRALPNQLLVWRALVLMDATTLRLPIEFDMQEAMTSFFRQLNGPMDDLARETAESWLIDARLAPELLYRGGRPPHLGRRGSRLWAKRWQVLGGTAHLEHRVALVALSVSLASVASGGDSASALWLVGSISFLLCATPRRRRSPTK